jgi:hypothetical protein
MGETYSGEIRIYEFTNLRINGILECCFITISLRFDIRVKYSPEPETEIWKGRGEGEGERERNPRGKFSFPVSFPSPSPPSPPPPPSLQETCRCCARGASALLATVRVAIRNRNLRVDAAISYACVPACVPRPLRSP